MNNEPCLNTFICDQNIFNDISLIDSIDNKNIFSVSLSCGGCRAYCMSLGIMRAIHKNNFINNKSIPYISGVSGSSWLTMILAHYDKSLDEILLFDIDRTYENLQGNDLINLSTDILPEIDILYIPIYGINYFSNTCTNKFLLSRYSLDDKHLSRSRCEEKIKLRENWPTYIISSTYFEDGFYYPVEFTPDYSLIGGKNVTLILNDVNTSIDPVRKHIKESMNDKLEHYGNQITTTNIITSSSFVVNILPSLTSYNLSICGKIYQMVDGAYNDFMAIVPLLRRKCKRIFCVVSTTLTPAGKLDIKNSINKTRDYYEDIFDNEQWDAVIAIVNDKVSRGEISYCRVNIDIRNNDYYHTTEYTPEIIFFFLSRVNEFMNTLPIMVANSPEMKNFPNFSMLLENGTKLLAYTRIQSYSLVMYSEWAFDRIFNENSDFFSMEHEETNIFNNI